MYTEGRDKYRSNAKTRDIRPTARILFLMTFRRSWDSSADVGDTGDVGDEIIATSSSSSSSFVQVLSTATSMSVTAIKACQRTEAKGA